MENEIRERKVPKLRHRPHTPILDFMVMFVIWALAISVVAAVAVTFIYKPQKYDSPLTLSDFTEPSDEQTPVSTPYAEDTKKSNEKTTTSTNKSTTNNTKSTTEKSKQAEKSDTLEKPAVEKSENDDLEKSPVKSKVYYEYELIE